MTSEITWHKSSYSNAAENCVEVAEGHTTHIRDTQNRAQAQLNIPSSEWTALLSALSKN
ncbi:DUF397 domain-containing protein [Nocardiopsis alba]|uniref:DUF397 domain-containing protein n=1 Tax=Nocardiopsis alba TaxID=53437 RepID=UPI000364158C|nr:DUF397 domain-containing protein [Nocardiopsis alba]